MHAPLCKHKPCNLNLWDLQYASVLYRELLVEAVCIVALLLSGIKELLLEP